MFNITKIKVHLRFISRIGSMLCLKAHVIIDSFAKTRRNYMVFVFLFCSHTLTLWFFGCIYGSGYQLINVFDQKWEKCWCFIFIFFSFIRVGGYCTETMKKVLHVTFLYIVVCCMLYVCSIKSSFISIGKFYEKISNRTIIYL